MGANRGVDHGDDFPPVLEEDFLALDESGRAPDPVSRIKMADTDGAGFVPATEESLGHLTPGCFVLFRSCDAFCWAEIVSIEGNAIGGRLHSELSSNGCVRLHDGTDTVNFRREQIKALGCERYCWC
jgi:hypothetical protein